MKKIPRVFKVRKNRRIVLRDEPQVRYVCKIEDIKLLREWGSFGGKEYGIKYELGGDIFKAEGDRARDIMYQLKSKRDIFGLLAEGKGYWDNPTPLRLPESL
jgi:hypothetical protein